MVVLKKIQIIVDRLEDSRTDVWEIQMLYKLVTKDLADPDTENYLYSRFSNPYNAFTSQLSQLYLEATQAA